MKVGVVGASGYAGVELLRLCAADPELQVVVALMAGGHAGQGVAHHTPSLAAAYPNLAYAPTDPSGQLVELPDWCSWPCLYGQSQHLIPDLVSKVGIVVDLAADFRLKDASLPDLVRRAPQRSRAAGLFSSSTGCRSWTARS